MVAIIENWSKIEGIIHDIKAHPKLDGYVQIHILLNKARAVKEYPNLALQDEGHDIVVSIPDQYTLKLKRGESFKKTVRKVFGKEYFMKLPR